MNDRNPEIEKSAAPVAVDSTRQKEKVKRKKAEVKRQKAEDRNQRADTPQRTPLFPHFLPIGKIVAAQGMKGEVRVYPESDFPERFLAPGKRWLQRSPSTPPEPIQLVRGRYLDGKGLYVVQFAGITDRTQAESLHDCKLFVPEGDRPPLEEGEFHILDLIGLEVFDQATHTPVGTVISIIQAGNDLLEVQRDSTEAKKLQTVLIPFVEAIVPIVDLQQRRIEITPPAGLIE
ncbi:MAG: ribosome maturation factor RimM [Stenomitos frigidus ULC029]